MGNVDVSNNEMSAWLEEMHFKEKKGLVRVTFVAGTDGVTSIEVQDISRGRGKTEELSLQSAVYMALTEARSVSKKN